MDVCAKIKFTNTLALNENGGKKSREAGWLLNGAAGASTCAGRARPVQFTILSQKNGEKLHDKGALTR